MKKILGILAIFMVIWAFYIYSPVDKYVGTTTKIGNNYTNEFTMFTGNDEVEFELTSDGYLQFDFRLTNGEFDLYLVVHQDKTVYQGNKVINGYFSVACQQGKYKLTIEAIRAQGYIKVYEICDDWFLLPMKAFYSLLIDKCIVIIDASRRINIWKHLK